MLYLAVAVLLWRILERPRDSQKGVWRRAAIGWIGAQVLFGALAWALAMSGILHIE
jgi:hypothetical protein